MREGIAIVLLCSTGYLLWLYSRRLERLTLYFWAGLSIKLIAGISIGLIYTYYYPVGDTFGFYQDALKLVSLFHQDISGYFKFLWSGDKSFEVYQHIGNTQMRSLFLVKVVSLVSLISMNNYWLISLYLSLISFLGSWFLVKKVIMYFPEAKEAAIISLLLLPSAVFWSAGITKESLASAALFYLGGIFLALLFNQRLKWYHWVITGVALVVLWMLKYYWAALFFPTAITTILIYKFTPRPLSKYNAIMWVLIFMLLCLGMSSLHPNFYLSRLLDVIVENHNAYIGLSQGKPSIHYYNLNPTWESIVLNSPWALFSGLYRPFIFEVNTFFQGVVAVENLVLLGLTLYNLQFVTRMFKSPHRILFLAVAVYIVLVCVFLALSTPNFGTLSRYRVGFLPILALILLYFPLQSFKNVKLN